MNAIDRKRLVQRLERDADAEAWADEFLYKHPKFIAGIVYYANRMLEEIESGAFDIKPHEGRTGQEIRVPGKPGWEDETHV